MSVLGRDVRDQVKKVKKGRDQLKVSVLAPGGGGGGCGAGKGMGFKQFTLG